MASLRSTCILQAKAEFETGRVDVYVFDIVHCNCGTDGLLAVAGSNNFINFYKEDNLQLANQISDHPGSVGTISSLAFSESQLWGSFTGGTIRSWDVRSGQKPVCVLEGYNKEPFNCVTANSASLLVGATDMIGEDANIYIWDVRSGRDPIGQFTESHSDDITQVLFSPSSPKYLMSGSTDGLVCIFDLTTMEEEEAIVSVKNSESSVANVGFFGPDSECVYCLTHQETFHTWSVTEAEPLIPKTNIREKIAEKFGIEVNYLVDCYYQKSNQKLFLVAGDHSGGMHIFHSNSKELQPSGLLAGGHTSTVRALLWSEDKGSIVSGGEDGAICRWLQVK